MTVAGFARAEILPPVILTAKRVRFGLVQRIKYNLCQTPGQLLFKTRLSCHGRTQTAGNFSDASPYVCETTKPLACDM